MTKHEVATIRHDSQDIAINQFILKKLAIITTHPIQYYAPLFKLLSADKRFDIKVFYTWGEESILKLDPGFKKVIEWDIPVLEGYQYEFLLNTASNKGSHASSGIINPDAIPVLNGFNPDCILVIGWNYHSHKKIIRHFGKRIPVWFRGDSTLLDEKPGLKSLAKHIFLKLLYSNVRKAFYAGVNNKAYFKEYGFKENQLVFCPHSIDNERFSADHSDAAAQLRERLGLNGDDLLILFAGKFEEKKNPMILLEVFKEIKEEHVHLLFVGNGYLESELKVKAQQNNSNIRNIHFMDFQNQSAMPAIYQSCDLFCLPSSGPGETWGLAVNEAMAAGRAILISDKVGCGTDLVKPALNGAIFQSGNKVDLEIKLRSLLEKKNLKDYGNYSQTIIKDWSIKRSADCIITELEKLN